FQFAGFDVDDQTVNGDFRSNERAVTDKVGTLDYVLAFAAENAEVFSDVVGQEMSLYTQGTESLQELHGTGFGDLAIGVPQQDNLFAAFDGTRQGQRTHSRACRPGQDVARIAQPDKLVSRDPEGLWQESIQPRIDAGQRYQGEFVSEIARMQTR